MFVPLILIKDENGTLATLWVMVSSRAKSKSLLSEILLYCKAWKYVPSQSSSSNEVFDNPCLKNLFFLKEGAQTLVMVRILHIFCQSKLHRCINRENIELVHFSEFIHQVFRSGTVACFPAGNVKSLPKEATSKLLSFSSGYLQMLKCGFPSKLYFHILRHLI